MEVKLCSQVSAVVHSSVVHRRQRAKLADMMETEGKKADICRRASKVPTVPSWCGQEVKWRRRKNSLVEVSVRQEQVEEGRMEEAQRIMYLCRCAAVAL